MNKVKSSLVATTGHLLLTAKSPDDALGELLIDVQHERVYSDGKTFLDLVPKKRMKQLQKEYTLAKQLPDFNLKSFVETYFYEPSSTHTNESYVSDPTQSVSEHIATLWSVLERKHLRDKGSLVGLPYAYVVPGGRFDEQFYWDSYFIMLGLAVENKWTLIEGMIKNYAFMIRKFGFIPTANRTYFLSRSQPPFLSHMVDLLASHKGKATYVEYLPYMLQEYRFWMKGRTKLAKQEHRAYARVVQTEDESLMNRYYDNKTTPRPESLYEDTDTAAGAQERHADRLYLHLRAGAESGWDFSARWFEDPNDIRTIHTADIIPVDLNCLLYQLEASIANTYAILKQPLLRRKFERLATRRAKAISRYCWDEEAGFFVDYNFHHQRPTDCLSLAGVFPLYARIASKEQAAYVAEKIERDFLQAGGLLATLNTTGQQWDAPNGWAPLHWITIQALRQYGYDSLADTIKHRWIATNENVYKSSHKLVEKYNVTGGTGLGGGGEYPLQDGFGWTNGVLEALLHDDEPKKS